MGDCAVDDNGIKDLKLEELNIIDNEKITDLNHMTSLKTLICNFSGNNVKVDKLSLNKLDSRYSLKRFWSEYWDNMRQDFWSGGLRYSA